MISGLKVWMSTERTLQGRSLTMGRGGPGPPKYLAHTIVKVGFGPPNIGDKKGLE